MLRRVVVFGVCLLGLLQGCAWLLNWYFSVVRVLSGALIVAGPASWTPGHELQPQSAQLPSYMLRAAGRLVCLGP